MNPPQRNEPRDSSVRPQPHGRHRGRFAAFHLLIALLQGVSLFFSPFLKSPLRSLVVPSFEDPHAALDTADELTTKQQQQQDETHWCILFRETMTNPNYVEHFPHAAENILPCWSWFRKTNSTHNCGIILKQQGYREGFKLARHNKTSWQKQLVEDAMGCQVRHEEGVVNLDEISRDPKRHVPNLKLKRPRFGRLVYLSHPDDAAALRRRLISDETIASVKGPGKPLQIGVVQRESNRVIANLQQVCDSLSRELRKHNVTFDMDITTRPGASPSTDETNSVVQPTLKQQAEWFATKDVIIGAHGAALINAVFITRGTLVMQLYAENYFWQSLDPLVEQAGGISLDWYKGESPHVDWQLAKQKGQQNQWRESNITADVEVVVDSILWGLELRIPLRKNMQREMLF